MQGWHSSWGRRMPVPVWEMSHLWAEALWSMLCASSTASPESSSSKLLQYLNPVSCQIAVMGKSHPG